MQRELIGGVRQPIPPIYTINTNRNKFSEGLVDPLERETITSLLSINSKFRDSYSKSTTDFNLDLNEPLTNVVSIKLASIEILNSYYTISEYLRTNTFIVEFFNTIIILHMIYHKIPYLMCLLLYQMVIIMYMV